MSNPVDGKPEFEHERTDAVPAAEAPDDSVSSGLDNEAPAYDVPGQEGRDGSAFAHRPPRPGDVVADSADADEQAGRRQVAPATAKEVGGKVLSAKPERVAGDEADDEADADEHAADTVREHTTDAERAGAVGEAALAAAAARQAEQAAHDDQSDPGRTETDREPVVEPAVADAAGQEAAEPGVPDNSPAVNPVAGGSNNKGGERDGNDHDNGSPDETDASEADDAAGQDAVDGQAEAGAQPDAHEADVQAEADGGDETDDQSQAEAETADLDPEAVDNGREPEERELTPEEIAHQEIMDELQERVDHANRMADHLERARDLQAMGAYTDTDWLVHAAQEASNDVVEYQARHADEFTNINLTSETADNVTRWTLDHPTPDTEAAPDTDPADTAQTPDSPEGSDESHRSGDIFETDEDMHIDVSDVPHAHLEMPDEEKREYDEVKSLGGWAMDKIWDRLSKLHASVLTATEDRTVERLRIFEGRMHKVDLYKVSQAEQSVQKSAYYVATGHTGFRKGVAGRFKEQELVPLRAVHGNHIAARKLAERQKERQDRLQNVQGSHGLRVFATAVKATYDAKRDAHLSKVIYKHERITSQFALMRERQALAWRMQHADYERGSRGDQKRVEIRQEYQRLREDERRLWRHHRTVRSQGLGHRVVRTSSRAAGKAVAGTARGTYKAGKWAAKRSADRIGDAIANRRAEQNGQPRQQARPNPDPDNRPPRNQGPRRQGAPKGRTPKQPNNRRNGNRNNGDPRR